jgi:predicted ribosome quality control (RQC) complex YloA/Tae2 family protein
MEIEIYYNKTAGKNADIKYKQKQKIENKIKGLKEAQEKILFQKNKVKTTVDQKKLIKIKQRDKQWYEKFRWFFTSNGYLVIAGRDAKSNEVVVKKHLEEKDLYFHADIHGAPHVVLKNGTFAEDIDKQEAATFAAVFSSAWKNHYFSQEVYSVNSDQVTKTPKSGESLGTGAFVIRGSRNYYRKLILELLVSFDTIKKTVVSGPRTAIEKQKFYFVLKPGAIKKSEACNILKKKFEQKKISVTTSEIDLVLPSGGFEIVE